MRFSFSLMFMLVCSSIAMGQDYSLAANYGEIELDGGFLPDPYTVELLAGGSVDASDLDGACIGSISDAPDLQLDFNAGSSTLFVSVLSDADTSLIINTPSGDWICDDDSGGSLNPLLEFSSDVSGVFDIWVGTVGSDDFADATLYISEIGNADTLDLSSVASATEAAVGARVETGQLEASDSTQANGAYVDSYTLSGFSGQDVVLDLRSQGFDSFLVVESPSGERFENDDYDGDTRHSMLNLTLDETGQYEVRVSSYSESETGSYTLTIDEGDSSAAPIDNAFNGELADGDSLRSGGQFVDSFEFEGRPGQQVSLDLTSDIFDTYLILESPFGAVLQNDDTDSTSHSVIETELQEFGTYRVSVTSYGSGETGDYRLRISEGGAATAMSGSRDTIALSLGDGTSGQLESGDSSRDDGRLQDYYSFSGSAGQNVRVELTSSDFDTYLTVISPDGAEIENDDYEGSTSQSVVELSLPSSGRYSVIASSYRENEVGSYRLNTNLSSASFSTASGGSSSGSNIYGIFVGISDYSMLRRTQPGWGDLSYTREDAIVARDALMDSAGMPAQNAITLLDSEATVENVRRAFADLSTRVDDDDTFVFFYSGHGGQDSRPGGPNAADADGFDETLALANGTINDDQVNELFNQIGSATSLIILDSCYSGGFAKDVVSSPGRMGLFSSDEDVPSLVAGKFEAGGYLSYFFKEAIENGTADEDGDRAINAMELSQYLHTRYNIESQSKARATFDTPNFGYQHLVADRGGITYDTILFRVD